MRRISLVVLVAGMLVAASALPAAADRLPGSDHGGLGLSTTLTGAAERPGPGDPDGSGTAEITLNLGQREVCWFITAEDIGQPTAAHIHRGDETVAGPIVVGLSPPAPDGDSTGCTTVSRALIDEIRDNPSAFYINVHSQQFPAGAIRGQL